MQLVPIRKKYVYEKLERIDRSTGRVYKAWNFDIPMPSVTTILDGTKDKTHLKQWAASVGEEEAERIRNEAAIVGTHMHNVVERLLLNRDLGVPRTWLAVRGYRMGYALVEHFFPHVDEVWGTEVPLYYPATYAGTSDCIGVYKGKPCIMDFKQTNKFKKREWIEDYFLQLAAYAMAHNEVYGTNIQQGVILMCSADFNPQHWVISGAEFQRFCDAWCQRVDQFYR